MLYYAFNVLFIEISLISSVYYADINAWQDKSYVNIVTTLRNCGSLHEVSCLVVRFRTRHDQCC